MKQQSLLDRSEIDFSEPDRQTWGTPQALYDALVARFGPRTLDVCAEAWSAKCRRYYTITDNGLAQPWPGHWHCNSPWNDAGDWVLYGLEQLIATPDSWSGWFILPSRTGRPWYRALKVREGHGAATIVELGGIGARVEYEPPPGAKASTNMEDTIVAFCWKPLDSQSAYGKKRRP